MGAVAYCIFTLPRKGSRGTLGTTYTMLCMDIQYTHLLHREDQARLSLTAKLHVLVSYSPGSLVTRLRERLLGHKWKLLGHVPQCALAWLRHWCIVVPKYSAIILYCTLLSTTRQKEYIRTRVMWKIYHHVLNKSSVAVWVHGLVHAARMKIHAFVEKRSSLFKACKVDRLGIPRAATSIARLLV